jgi:AbrB family looped-hinge helix DNA binding protein
MITLTVTAKGQVTLRKDVLQHLGIQPGEKISVDKLPDGRLQVRATRQTGDIAAAFGVLKRPGQRRLSIEEINDLSAKGWAGQE